MSTKKLVNLRNENARLRLQRDIEREQQQETQEVQRLQRENRDLRKELVSR